MAASFSEWLSSRVVVDAAAYTTAQALFDDYAAEMRAGGVIPMTRLTFARALADRNIQVARIRRADVSIRLYRGVRLAQRPTALSIWTNAAAPPPGSRLDASVLRRISTATQPARSLLRQAIEFAPKSLATLFVNRFQRGQQP
ncbi:hypothetical protein [uncultured Caulobacter sp.]|jgi:hypothetical protein|uniref:hypothetical protein n=1 Tax=uncultured Caulobacter sp. TaxID=158749 RepID=UPI0026210FEF|nr:hypothetical protein [uncultured Caulobacter sp.]